MRQGSPEAPPKHPPCTDSSCSSAPTLSREWMRQYGAHSKVRRLVSIDGPHHGIINCSPNPLNYYATIGFTPDAPVCVEYGAADTPFLGTLNAGDETPGPTEYLAFVNVDTSFVYIDERDGTLPAVPAEDRNGEPHDFSKSAYLDGAETIELTGMGAHDQALLAAHTGIVNSPEVWQATFEFLTRGEASDQPTAAIDAPAPAPGGTIPATGHEVPLAAGLVLLLATVTRLAVAPPR